MRALKIVGLVLAGLVTAGVLFVLLFDINWVKGWLAQQASDSAGREIRIEGDIAIDWAWTPRITIEGLKVANASWGEAPHLASVETLEVTIRLDDLLRGRTVLPEITVLVPELFLERNADGRANWDLADDDDVVEEIAEEVVVPDDRTEIPIVERLAIEGGRFAYRDATRAIELAGTIARVVGEGGGGERVRLEAEGALGDEPFRIDLSGGPLTALRDPEKPYPIELQARVGDTEAAIAGTLTRPMELAGLDLNLEVSGASMSDMFPLTGVPTPPTPSYQLSGDLAHEGQTWRVENLAARLGSSDLSGTVEVDLGQEPLVFAADLRATKLDLDDLAGFIGAPTDEEEDAADGDRLIPDQAINLVRLRAANGQVHFRATEVLAPGPPIEDLDAELTLGDGVLRLQPASFGVAGGHMDLWVSLYGTKDPVQIDMLTRIRDLSLREAFPESEEIQEMGGIVNGRIELSGPGNSLREMLGHAGGSAYVVMSDGHVSGLIIEAIGLDVAEALGLYLGDDVPVDVRCLVVDLAADQGVVQTEAFVLDTVDTLVEGQGWLDLGMETIDLTLTPKPKDISVLSFRSEIQIEGTWSDLSVAPDIGSMFAFLPPIDLGTAEDAPCGQMIERARQDTD